MRNPAGRATKQRQHCAAMPANGKGSFIGKGNEAAAMPVHSREHRFHPDNIQPAKAAKQHKKAMQETDAKA